MQICTHGPHRIDHQQLQGSNAATSLYVACKHGGVSQDTIRIMSGNVCRRQGKPSMLWYLRWR